MVNYNGLIYIYIYIYIVCKLQKRNKNTIMETLYCDIYCGNCRDTGNYLRSSLSFRNNSDILNIIFFLPNTPFKTLVVFDFFINTLYLTGIPSPFSRFFTSKNTIILPNFLVWKFCGKAQFPHSFGRIEYSF